MRSINQLSRSLKGAYPYEYGVRHQYQLCGRPSMLRLSVHQVSTLAHPNVAVEVSPRDHVPLVGIEVWGTSYPQIYLTE